MDPQLKKLVGAKVKALTAAELGASEKSRMVHIGLVKAWFADGIQKDTTIPGTLIKGQTQTTKDARITWKKNDSPTAMLNGVNDETAIAFDIIHGAEDGDGLAGYIDTKQALFLFVPKAYVSSLNGGSLTEQDIEAILKNDKSFTTENGTSFSESDNALAFILFRFTQTSKISADEYRLIASARKKTRKFNSWKNRVENFQAADAYLSKLQTPGETLEPAPGFTGGTHKRLYPTLKTSFETSRSFIYDLAASELRVSTAEQTALLLKVGFEPKHLTIKKFMDTYPNRLLRSMTAKPFAVLAGGTGTGKTRWARILASSFEGSKNVEVIAVGADWTDNRMLLGFRNLLAGDGKVYVAPPALRIILKALSNPGSPYFLILDEMNLSHVERYFADFLSSMESKEPLKLHDCAEALKTEDGILVEGKVAWPSNLFVIGTVNIDETTYMFSPKVLDRAHVIEFKVAWDEIEGGLEGAVPGELLPLRPEQVQEFMRVAQVKDKALSEEDHEALIKVLRDMHEALDGSRFVFAHRTARECLNFIASAQALAKADIVPPQDTKDLIDLAILQKALPKLNGATGTLSKVLEDLIKVADKHDLNLCKDKLEAMSRQLKADQFVSFIQ